MTQLFQLSPRLMRYNHGLDSLTGLQYPTRGGAGQLCFESFLE